MARWDSNMVPNKLDKIRMQHGGRVLIKEYQSLISDDKHSACDLINDQHLHFPTLFILKSAIEESKVNESLNERNQIACSHIKNTLSGSDLGINNEKHFSDQHHITVASFNWMLKSGASTLLNPSYIQVLDSVAIQLLLNYREDVIKDVVDLIFFRHRFGTYSHYLIWAFYESCQPNALVFVMNYLLSSDTRDVKLANKLLAFIPNFNHFKDRSAAFEYVTRWLEENISHLYYTYETNDVSAHPVPFQIDYFSKYMGIIIAPSSGQPLNFLTMIEQDRWHYFNRLPTMMKVSLANYSSQLRKINRVMWRRWMLTPLDNQILAVEEEPK